MNPLIHLKKITLPLLMTVVLACIGLLPQVEAVSPPPDGGYPNFTTAEGQNAVHSLTTGAGNTGLGWYSLTSDTTGSLNTAVGAGTLISNNGDSNTAFGAVALLSNTTGNYNTAVGAFALFANTTGVANVANGRDALSANTTGGFNVANGRNALSANTTGGFNVANGDGALSFNTTGFYNVADGNGALSFNTVGVYNTALGSSAGYNLTTGSGNVCIGANVVGVAGESNTTHIRNIGSTPIIGGTTVVLDGTGGIGAGKLGYASSSRRYKEEIKPMDKASKTLFALKPVTFRAKGNMDPAHVKHYGLIAEDVAAVDSDLVVYNPEGKPETLRFDSINAMLLNEFLKEHNAFIEEQRKVQKLEATVAELRGQLKEQAAQIQKVSAQLEASKPAPQVVNNP